MYPKIWSILEKILSLTTQKKPNYRPLISNGATEQIIKTSCILSYYENFYLIMKNFILL